MLFAGLVENGIVGAIIPALLVVLIRLAAIVSRGSQATLVMLVCMSSCWDVMFPLDGLARSCDRKRCVPRWARRLRGQGVLSALRLFT